jgi:DNA-directed RNA polymerase subunit beta'
MAFDAGEIELGSLVKIRLRHVVPTPLSALPEGVEARRGRLRVAELLVETTLGRALFNETLPMDYPFVNDQVDKKRLSTIVNDLAERYSKVQVAASLDALKEYGFHWATRSGTTVAISDVVTPPRKLEILEGYEAKATKVQTQYERGLITDDERRQELIEIWTQATNEVAKEMEPTSRGPTPSSGWCPRVPEVTGCSCARSPVCVAWCPTRRARSSRDRSARTSARACRCSSSSSPPTVA